MRLRRETISIFAVLVTVLEGKVAPNTRVDCYDTGLSQKARRHFCGQTSQFILPESRETVKPTPKPIESQVEKVKEEEKEKFYKPDGPIEFTVTGIVEEESSWLDDNPDDYLPECSTLEATDIQPCKNTTEPVPVIRWRDIVFEKLIQQSWNDVQTDISDDNMFQGVNLEPLMVDHLVGTSPTVTTTQSTLTYTVDLDMWDIQVNGLSSVYLSEVLVTRAQNLYDLDIMAEFTIDEMSVNGMYNLNGSYLGWFGSSFTSGGDQKFEVSISNATLTPRVVLDTSDLSPCGEIGDVMITQMELPFDYDDFSISFDGLGYGLNTVLNGVSIFVMQTQQQNMENAVKETIKGYVHSLIC